MQEHAQAGTTADGQTDAPGEAVDTATQTSLRFLTDASALLGAAAEPGRPDGSAIGNAALFRGAEGAPAPGERLEAVTAALAGARTPAQVGRVVVEEGLPAVGGDAGGVYALTAGEGAFELLS